MSIQYNENIKIAAPAPLDKRYLSIRSVNGVQVPYSSTTEVNNTIILSERYIGLTVNVNGVEYWYKDGILDNDLIEKKYNTEFSIDNIITGGTNIGYFSGYSGIQILPINHLLDGNYDGNYQSLYNYYYRGVDGKIHTGVSPIDGIGRRGYYSQSIDKSWLWNEYTGSSNIRGWILVDGNIENNIGVFLNGVTYYTGIGLSKPYTGATWQQGVAYNNGSNLVINAVIGSVNTGTTYIVGSPVYSHTDNSLMNYRTIKSKTPNYINVSYDESFIYLSGASAIISAQNVGVGTGVYKTRTGDTIQFKSLKGSGDTFITQSGDDIIIFSSSESGSGYAITGATNIGSGVGIYSNVDYRKLQLRTIIGSGSTIINQSGDSIIINSIGGGVFTENIVVSIADGKTFGKYVNGDIIPSSGKTAQEVIKMALTEALEPTVNLSSSGNDVVFGKSQKIVNLSFSYTINTLNAHVDTVLLEWRRNDTGDWNVLPITTDMTQYAHVINETDRFDSTIINYRYTVTDSEGATKTVTHNVTPEQYAAPTMSITLNGTITSPETQNVREKGNVISSPSGTISSNRALVNITAWTLERRYNGGTWQILSSASGLNVQSVSIPQYNDNTGIPTNATSIEYRIGYTDEYTSGNGGNQSITFKYFSYWGFNTNTTINETQIEALSYKNFKSSVALTWNNINTPIGNYTYYAYPSTYNDITSIIKNGVNQDFGAWSKLSDVSVTNSYGETLTYKVYRTNATGAYGATDCISIT